MAPMAGVTDHCFRRLCRMEGCDLTFTEMVSAKGMHYGSRKTRSLIRTANEERPCAVQLFGSEPDIMAEITSVICDEYADEICLIDINCGCPAPKITSNGEGSALMRDIPGAARVIEATVRASRLPVSVKFRKGWDANSINAVEFARMCEQSGASMVTVHGRTRESMYTGSADWDIIAQVVDAVSIPVIGNGDIFSAEAALSMRERTGCAGIMVARGAQGDPFIFREIRCALDEVPYSPPTDVERMDMAIRHARSFIEEKEPSLLPELRKHMAWYSHGMHGSTEFRCLVNSARNADEMLNVLYNFRDSLTSA